MSLSLAYIIVGAVFCAFGGVALFAGARVALVLLAFPRARVLGNVLWAGAIVWFLYHLWRVSEVDLAGFPRNLLLVVFGGAGVLAFKYLQDLLPLRALAALVLFCCAELLRAGFNQVPQSCVLAGTAYVLIVVALWTGAAPYVLRNAISKICVSAARIRLAGAAFALVGLANFCALAFV